MAEMNESRQSFTLGEVADAITADVKAQLAKPKPVSFVRSMEFVASHDPASKGYHVERHTAIYDDGSVWQRSRFEWEKWDFQYGSCHWQRVDMVPDELLMKGRANG